MLAGKMPKVGFAVFFMVAVLGAVLLLISQVPLTREYYEVVDTRSFSLGELMTFYSNFEANVEYRFEMKGVNSTSWSRYAHYLSVGNDTELWGSGGFTDPPWIWYHDQQVTCAYNVTFFRYVSYNYTYMSKVIERATTSAFVEISQLRETTYRLTYLIYAGLPLLIVGAILITITGKDAGSRMRTPDTNARFFNSPAPLCM